MNLPVIQTVLTYAIVYAFAFEDFIYVYGDGSQEMLEQGRQQYQLLREKSNLPQYGTCWKSAVEHINEGCRHLSEDTQSDIALHITNCFLAMSGHETYNCELDKKPNLRGICINNMSDRAFNVYTEFYTHTQNMCWFLRGQIWHETIAENTLKVGAQLKLTARHQEDLMLAQQESLLLQEKMLNHGRFLEKVLEELYNTTTAHQDVLMVTAQAVVSLQSWIVGEVSWIDSLFYYAMSMLPLYVILFCNFVAEQLYASLVVAISNDFDTANLYGKISSVNWILRYVSAAFSVTLLAYHVYKHKDLAVVNNQLLSNIQKQNSSILMALAQIKANFKNLDVHSSDQVNVVSENNLRSFECKLNNLAVSVAKENNEKSYTFSSCPTSTPNNGDFISNKNVVKNVCGKVLSRQKLFPLSELQNVKYNLRSRQGTPESNI